MTRHRLAGACSALYLLLTANAAMAQRELKNIPDPNPELERATFIVPEGFEVNLFAGDPRIAKPRPPLDRQQ